MQVPTLHLREIVIGHPTRGAGAGEGRGPGEGRRAGGEDPQNRRRLRRKGQRHRGRGESAEERGEETGEEGTTGLPSSNVLYFDLTDDAWCCARPSGTEPKIKFYMGIKGTSLEDAETQLNALTDALKSKI